MKQSKVASLIESVTNILVGFGIACIAQAIFLPLLGVPIPWTANFIFAGIMTVISIARSYVLRRVFEALHIRRPLSPFMQAVVAERFRQIEVEGWSLTHDDKHIAGELAQAGASYAISGAKACEPSITGHFVHARGAPAIWPWSLDWWKPTDFRRDLVKACALIVAEGERHDRNRKKPSVASSDPADARIVHLTPGRQT